MDRTEETEGMRARFTAAVAASGRTVADIEASAGLKRDRLRDFLAGRKSSIGLSDASAIADELGTSLTWLAGNSDPERGAA